MRMRILNWLKTKPTLMLLLERSVININSVPFQHRLVMTGQVRVTARASHACAWSMAVWSSWCFLLPFKLRETTVFLTGSKICERSGAQGKIILRLNPILIFTLSESLPEASLKLPWTGRHRRNSEVTKNILCGPFYYNSNCKSIISALKTRISFIVCASTCHFVRTSVPRGWFLCWKP